MYETMFSARTCPLSREFGGCPLFGSCKCIACIYGNSSWYIDCCPLYGRCPLLGVSDIGGSTVVLEDRSERPVIYVQKVN